MCTSLLIHSAAASSEDGASARLATRPNSTRSVAAASRGRPRRGGGKPGTFRELRPALLRRTDRSRADELCAAASTTFITPPPRPLLFFGGLWFPRERMPPVLQHISEWSPLGASVHALQDSMQGTFPS